ncbi:nuclear transport factor 2 family protein [Kitasatospora sp. NPDC091207]|uniref:nuclear transport factor 2 family protein n=1 Tax=Kitasatospora sp. NPDC091207 TaxID=3364083 RepID=UPI00381A008B
MTAADSPREVAARLLEGLGNQDWDTLRDLYAEDVVIDWPLALPTPARVRGKDALRQALQKGWAMLDLRLSLTRLHETTDPEVVIAEYDYAVTGVGDG